VRVVISGGGTAGHVLPALALADRLREGGAEVSFVGSAEGQEAKLVPEAGYAFRGVRVAPAQNRLSPASVRALTTAWRAARGCRPLVGGANVVVGIGGYASAPGIWAARSTRTPVVLIEQNSVPGAVNRLAARWAKAVALTFADAAERLPRGTRTVVTGNPVRPGILAVPANRPALAEEARTAFDLGSSRRTVLVLGGSQGALHLDQAVAGALALLRDRSDLQLLVAAGTDHVPLIEDAARDTGSLLVRALGYIERMDLALAVADLAVSRAGAGHIAELAVCGVPAVFVPYPHATENHQEANARELARAGAADVLRDADLSPERLVRAMLAVVEDAARSQAMSAAMTAWAKPDATERLAELVTEVAGG
jgi:UDP-N-acetylglucosamine--N-acetylmuramyl-(pentapeptide) pyrophosphoryl-undecaprenol N-acetylglucosamine transferase